MRILYFVNNRLIKVRIQISFSTYYEVGICKSFAHNFVLFDTYNYNYLPYTTFCFYLIDFRLNTDFIYLSLHRVPKDVGSKNKISPFIPILSIPISLEEGAASNDIIFPSLPWFSLSVGTRDHFHKNAFEKTHVAHSANMTTPGQL